MTQPQVEGEGAALFAIEKPANQSAESWIPRMRDPARWTEAAHDLLIWFMAGILLTQLLSHLAPGKPILVGTESIPKGIYWLDQTAISYARGDYATFIFEPTQAWLKERYSYVDSPRVHTKQVAAVAGDTISARDGGKLEVCYRGYNGHSLGCEALGAVMPFDSKGRPMQGWLADGASYTLQPGEVWVYGQHAKSLDSRYQGPVNVSILQGKARPLTTW